MEHDLLREIGLSILAACLLGFIGHLFRLPLILTYIFSGMALGPHMGLGLIQSSENILLLSEIGIIFLMFILGLEINLTKLLQSGKAVFITGNIQFVGCLLLAYFFFSTVSPISFIGSSNSSFSLLYISFCVSLSSTLLVVKILSERMELDTLTSRITLGILVLQDLWAIGLIAIQPNLDLNHFTFVPFFLSIGRVMILVGLAGLMSRFILPAYFYKVAKQPELLLVSAIGWCFGLAGLAHLLHLSLEMGALVAGIAMASLPYHFEVATKISSLRDFFVTLFFVALGLQIPVPTPEIMVMVGWIILFTLFSRVLLVFPSLYFLHYGNRAALIPGLNLAQVSEFSFIILTLGLKLNHLHHDKILSAFIISFAFSALLSSLIIPQTHTIYRWMRPIFDKFGPKEKLNFTFKSSDQPSQQNADEMGPQSFQPSTSPTIVMIGFYREASSLLREFGQRHSADFVSHLLVVDYNPETLKNLTQMGVPCRYADLTHLESLQQGGIDKTEIFISTIPDQLLKGTSNLKILRFLRKMAPQAKIIVNAETLESAHKMYREGANYVFMPRFITAHFLADVLDRIQSGQMEALHHKAQAYLGKIKEILP